MYITLTFYLSPCKDIQIFSSYIYIYYIYPDVPYTIYNDEKDLDH